MRVEYDRSMCTGWFQCVQEWDAFEMDMAAGKATLKGSEESNQDTFVRKIPDALEGEAIAAAESCPVNAIRIYDDGEQVTPSG